MTELIEQGVIEFVLTATFGALIQEFFYWYDLRGKLHYKKYKKMLKSKSYWILTISMILISGIGTTILYFPEINDMRGLQLVLGAAFPLIFKKLISGLLQNTGRELGTVEFKDYFN